MLLTVRRRTRRHPMPSAPVVGVAGPRWLRDLLSYHAKVVTFPLRDRSSLIPDLVIVGPGADLHTHDGFTSELPLVGYRSRVEPSLDRSGFVEPMIANPTRLSLPSDLPSDLQVLALQAAGRVEVPKPTKWPSRTADMWLEQTAVAHAAYRQAHQRWTRDLLEEAYTTSGRRLEPRDEEVTVVCVTNRPANLANVLATYQRQRYPHRRLLLVTNSDQFRPDQVQGTLADVPGAEHIHVDEHRSLGHCLNLAVEACATRFMAKIDDDDWYGPDYLGDLILSHRFADAAVVGKHTYHAYVEDIDQTVLRFPGHEFSYTSHLAGGTLVIDLSRLAGARFPDQTVGEDSGFLAACQRRGLDVYSADRFNYLQLRGGDNTWRPRLSQYLKKTTPVGRGRAEELVEA